MGSGAPLRLGRWLPVVALCVLVMSGCLGGSGAPGRSGDLIATDPPLVIPSTYEVPGASLVSRSDTSATFMWSGTAGLGAAGTSLVEDPALVVPVPARLPLLLRATLNYLFVPHQSLLDLEISDARGRVVCLQDAERLAGDQYSSPCVVAMEAVHETENWRVRVIPERNVDPTLTFEVELQWTVRAPRHASAEDSMPVSAFEPHVIVAITDTGVNPYHEVFFRPNRTAHPCTYIQDFPCNVSALPLSVGEHMDLDAAYEADADLWQNLIPGRWYWIPKTPLVAVHCAKESPYDQVRGAVGLEPPRRPVCILDNPYGTGHGTGTSSAVLMENPDALLVINQGSADDQVALLGAPFPIDVHSFSHGPPTPLIADEQRVYLGDCQDYHRAYVDPGRLFVASAGNSPGSGTPSTLIDCAKGNPNIIPVGGAFASDGTQSVPGTLHPEVVSWYCRPTARHDSVDAFRNSAGTSFAAPTVAGAISRVILDLRRHSGYVGNVVDDEIDPTLGISNADLRTAMNLTASYDPRPQYNNTSTNCGERATGLALNPLAPWQQWGWGFYDRTTTNATVAHLLGREQATHPTDAITWMETQHEMKKRLWGT